MPLLTLVHRASARTPRRWQRPAFSRFGPPTVRESLGAAATRVPGPKAHTSKAAIVYGQSQVMPGARRRRQHARRQDIQQPQMNLPRASLCRGGVGRNVGANGDLLPSAAINGRNGMKHDNGFAEFDDPRQADTTETTAVPATEYESLRPSTFQSLQGSCSSAHHGRTQVTASSALPFLMAVEIDGRTLMGCPSRGHGGMP